MYKNGCLTLLLLQLTFSLFLLLMLISTWVGIIKAIKKEYPEDYKKITAFTSYKAVLLLRKPLKFNETGTIHVKAITDDFDHKAQPHLDYKVNNEINVIHFRVTLKDKADDFNLPAKLLKKPIDSSTPVDYQQYGSVPFDMMSKSYQYYLTEPEMGYYYRLEWEK